MNTDTGLVWSVMSTTRMQIRVRFILTSICEDGTVIFHYTDRETEAQEAGITARTKGKLTKQLSTNILLQGVGWENHHLFPSGPQGWLLGDMWTRGCSLCLSIFPMVVISHKTDSIPKDNSRGK